MQTEDNELDTIVVGLGKTGLACLRHLHGRGLNVSAVDTRAEPPMLSQARKEVPGIEIRTGALDAEFLGRARRLVVSPGVPVNDPAIESARRSGVEVIGDVELFARSVRTPIIGITGSNGKSTVTRLVEFMGRETGVDVAAAGNIGTPALEMLSEPEHAFYVVELSSFQLETTESLRPAVSVVLNVSHDHMDRYARFKDYLNAKRRIHTGAKAVVVNRDDPNTFPTRTRANTYSFGLDRPASERDFGVVDEDGGDWLASGNERLLEAGKLKLSGRHNWANVLAALALAKAVGWDIGRCAEAAARFRGLPHRMELVARINGVRWVNDSKATNVGATIAALSGAGAPVVLIAGGDGKGADFGPLKAAVGQYGRGLVLFGRDANLIDQAVGEGVVAKYRAETLEQAVEQAFKLAEPGDTVLFSPACASFDMFDNYEQRGDAFRSAVRGLS